MEWTLPHPKTDSRGNRRYFTLASSPTESEVRIGVKFNKRSSSFKKALLALDSHTPLVASQLSGDFVLPKDRRQKLVFIAGGIGVTPYRSMVKYLLDSHEARPITLLYSARTSEDFAYTDIFEQAKQAIGLKTVYATTDTSSDIQGDHVRSGRINAAMIQQEIPDYMERLFYISGTQAMVTSLQQVLVDLGVPRHQVKVDYFPGYA